MKLTVNREFLGRHLFVVVLLAGMGCWFGYDGFVKYPNTPPASLYSSIEKSDPPPTMTAEKLDAFKAQKVMAQRGLFAAMMLAALAVGAHLFAVTRLRFEFDDGGFTWNGRRYAYADIKAVNRDRWTKKGILLVTLNDGRKLTLDSWHHIGVAECEQKMI